MNVELRARDRNGNIFAATLVGDEKDLGSVCIDMGGGTTGIAVFLEGEVVYTGTIPLGGNHVTNDIARGL